MADKIKLIPFLNKVVERNTRHYKQDFQQDAQKLRDAGERGDIPLGTVVKINYREQVRRVIEKALPVEAVELTFYSREQITLPIDKYRNNQEQIFFDYGAIQHLRYIPKNEAELCRAILMEHRFQKGWKPRKGQKPQNPSR